MTRHAKVGAVHDALSQDGTSGQSPAGDDHLIRDFRDSTMIWPPDDLANRIRMRIAEEPPSTAPRRFLAALRALSLHGIWRGFVQSARAAFGPGTRSVLLRAQALIVVLAVIGTTGIGSVAAVTAAARVVSEVRAHVASQQRQAPSGTRSSRPASSEGVLTRAVEPQHPVGEAASARQRAGRAGAPPAGQPAQPPTSNGKAPAAPDKEGQGQKGDRGKSDSAPRGRASDDTPSASKGKKPDQNGGQGRSADAPRGGASDDTPASKGKKPGRNGSGSSASLDGQGSQSESGSHGQGGAQARDRSVDQGSSRRR